jgi:hypothetical protein
MTEARAIPSQSYSGAVSESGPFKALDEHLETVSGHVSIGTMHLANGLEFRAVVVMACDDEIIPLQERIETVGDDADLHGQLKFACPQEREELAYKAQNGWLVLFGHDLEHDFQLEGFSILVKTKCFY